WHAVERHGPAGAAGGSGLSRNRTYRAGRAGALCQRAGDMKAVFAIPGDIETRTGGFIYERALLMALREAGHDVEHLQLPAGFPDPTAAEMAEAVAALAALPADVPLILDGLVYGAIETEGLAQVRAPIVAMIHHP